MKKMILSVLIAVMLLGASLPVKAETMSFVVTVNKKGVGEDNVSKKTQKAGGSRYENRFYVTVTKFEIKNTINLYSRQVTDINMTSYPCQFKASETNKTKNNPNVGDAPFGKKYRLHAYFGGKSGTAKARGRFTP